MSQTVRTITIEGAAMTDIAAFYREINRVMMDGESRQIGDSLDALSDLLYGGFGAISGQEKVRLVWRDIGVAQAALGIEATLAYYRAKLTRPGVYNIDTAQRAIDALEQGKGQTYFDIVLEIIGEHGNIELVKA